MNAAADPGISPLLVLAWGNPSRGDDALGPLFAEKLATLQLQGVEIQQDYQLQIEYSLDLQQRECVLFVDASANAPPPYAFHPLRAERDNSYTSHSLSPQALLSVYEQVNQAPAPPSFLLAIRGYQFELGRATGEKAQLNLRAALDFAARFLQEQRPGDPP